jgi:hypothetical protein
METGRGKAIEPGAGVDYLHDSSQGGFFVRTIFCLMKPFGPGAAAEESLAKKPPSSIPTDERADGI